MTQTWTNQKLFEQIVENLRKNDELPDGQDMPVCDMEEDTEECLCFEPRENEE